jgi:hypothetical protein
MAYQDKWLKGEVVQEGYRECAERYKAVKRVCDDLKPDFTVCDIGANFCYFGIRLTEDFPQCRVMAFEFHAFKRRAAHLKKSGADRVTLINHKVHIGDLRMMSRCCHFDLVLALSVLHHMDGRFEERLRLLRSLGDKIIIEFAGIDSPRVCPQPKFCTPTGGKIVGYGDSHKLEGFKRPIVLL